MDLVDRVDKINRGTAMSEDTAAVRLHQLREQVNAAFEQLVADHQLDIRTCESHLLDLPRGEESKRIGD